MLERLNFSAAQPPLYYLILDSWEQAMGDSQLMLRMLSLLLALIALAAAIALGRKLFSLRTTLILSLLLLSAPFFLQAASSATGASLGLALAGLSTLALYSARGLWRSLGYVLLLALALLAHPLSLLLIPLHIGLMLARSWRSRLPVYTKLQARRLPALAIAVLLLVCGWQLLQGPRFTQVNPAWQPGIEAAAQARTALEPALIAYSPDSPAAYYARSIPLRQGVSIDAGWQTRPSEDNIALAESMASADSVWLFAATQQAATWDFVQALIQQGRGVGYRDSVADLLMYRFDAAGQGLRFRFGEDHAYSGPIGDTYAGQAGQDLCIEAGLSSPESLRLQLTLSDAGGQSVASTDATAKASGEACLSLPEALSAGTYRLMLRVYPDQATDEALALYEVSAAEAVFWGESLGLGWVATGG